MTTTAAAGALAGISAGILLQPLDVVKTRMLTGESRIRFLPLTSQIIRNEGVTALWMGSVASLIRLTGGVGVYFSILTHFFPFIDTQSPGFKWETFGVGVFARSIATITMAPASLLKTRMESGIRSSASVKTILKSEGLSGFSKGVIPTLIRDSPYSGLLLLFVSSFRRTFETRVASTDAVNILSGGLGGALATIVTHPGEVLKTYSQLNTKPGFTRLLPLIQNVYSKDGVSGFFRAAVPRVIRRSLSTALIWYFLRYVGV